MDLTKQIARESCPYAAIDLGAEQNYLGSIETVLVRGVCSVCASKAEKEPLIILNCQWESFCLIKLHLIYVSRCSFELQTLTLRWIPFWSG